jgi:hypothetical protein
VIFSKIEEGPINSINLVVLRDLVNLVGPVDLIDTVALVGLRTPFFPIISIASFFIFEQKFPMRLVLTRVCVLAQNKSLGGSFSCNFLITFSNEH